MALTQANRRLHLSTVLGTDVLLLTSFSGSEEMSRLFRYQLEMISDDAGIKPQDIVGTPVGWSVERGDGSRRHFHGYVSGLSRGDVDREDRRNYSVEVVPWLWFLTQTSDCKIFQEKDVPTITDEVLADFGGSDYDTDFQLSHKQWEYCVQYRETDFNFLSRLWEQEGIFYYFKHEQGAHKLVLTDHKNGYYPLPESEVDLPPDEGGRAIDDHLTDWQRRFQFVSGKYVQRDFNFETPTNDLETKTDTIIDLPYVKDFEVYDYPGEYADKDAGKGETKVRMEEEETTQEVVDGASLCRTFQVGGTFKIGQHRDGSEEGSEVVITSIHHVGNEPLVFETGTDAGVDYRNSFSCIPAERVFRPSRCTAKPVISGVQTAIVTGPPSEEIYPDEYGRVKCQFHWDRYGSYDDKSSCWIRVSQVHAGLGFGGIDIPRIGEEVVVSFIEGDPDRPLITGRVYHKDNMPPYGLPDSKNISGMKSNSTKGGGGYNEYVMDDTKGNELIREHGQFDKDSTIENDLREHVLNNRSRDVAVDETISIGNDQSITIGNNQTLQVGVGRTITVGATQDASIGADLNENVASNRTTAIGADDTLNVSSNQKHAVGSNRETNVGSNDTLKVGSTLSVSAGQTIELSAGTKIKLAVGGSVIEITPAGITITGPKVTSSAQAIHEITGALVKIN